VEVDAGKKTRFNDGKCDSKGRFWAGTMSLEKSPAVVYEEGSGSIYSYTEERGIRQHETGITISNGFAWNAEETLMFYIDSFPRKVYVYKFDKEKGEISDRRVLKDFAVTSVEEYGFPDGCCVDADDNLWVAMYNGGKVVCLNTSNGDIIREVRFPVKRITSACFGGDNLDELYVTSGVYGLSEKEFAEEQPLAGSLFKVVNLKTKGRLGHKFAVEKDKK